jgi:tetratricopeptide (TPR) repeat protein
MRTTAKFLKVTWSLLLVGAAGWVFAQLQPAPTKAPAPKPGAPATKAAPTPSLQSHRNLGKAYYEQGKYVEAASEFQKLAASGNATATDYLNLGMALMQDYKFDAALGALTTAKQMDSKLLAADYNLGILLKREQRFPDAEAHLKRVLEADPDDPAAWFNLGAVYFAQKKLELALSARQHVVEMGFGRAQNFYVASLFHSFTILVRLNRRLEAQKFLKMHEEMRDKVPGLALQNPALEGGKYGTITVPPPGERATLVTAPRGRVTLVDVTAKLGLAAIFLSPTPSPEKFKAISAGQYSLEFARRELVPLIGPTTTVADYDGDGRADLYVVNPAGPNRLFRQIENDTFTEVTAKTGVAGPGASLSATFADYDNSQHLSLFLAGLGGIRLYRNQGDGTFVDETSKAGLGGCPGELATRAVLFEVDFDGWLDLFVTV